MLFRSPSLTLELIRTPDILAEVKGNFLKVGFAAESEDVVANARQKLEKKQLDIIIANDITDASSGFGVDTNKVTLIDRDGKTDSLPLLTKREVADKILDRVVGLLSEGVGEQLGNIVETTLERSYIEAHFIYIPVDKEDMFPSVSKWLTLVTDIGEIQAQFYCPPHQPHGRGFSKGLTDWFKKLRVKEGDKVRITPIEPMKKYHLEILKE